MPIDTEKTKPATYKIAKGSMFHRAVGLVKADVTETLSTYFLPVTAVVRGVAKVIHGDIEKSGGNTTDKKSSHG